MGEDLLCLPLEARSSHRVSQDARGGREQQSSVARMGMGRTGGTMRGLGREEENESLWLWGLGGARGRALSGTWDRVGDLWVPRRAQECS